MFTIIPLPLCRKEGGRSEQGGGRGRENGRGGLLCLYVGVCRYATECVSVCVCVHAGTVNTHLSTIFGSSMWVIWKCQKEEEDLDCHLWHTQTFTSPALLDDNWSGQFCIGAVKRLGKKVTSSLTGKHFHITTHFFRYISKDVRIFLTVPDIVHYKCGNTQTSSTIIRLCVLANWSSEGAGGSLRIIESVDSICRDSADA